MATIMNRLQLITNITAIFKVPSSIFPSVVYPAIAAPVSWRSYWTDWKMKKDVRKRETLRQFAKERMRINSLRKNSILPKILQEEADREIEALPRDSSIVRIHRRCVISSRPRGVIRKWRMSRIVWRDLADHNYLSGVQRAMW